jgi:hypothetical protein
MAKKMKLVPQGVYERLMKGQTQIPVDDELQRDQELRQQKRNILSASDIPDDLKALLYQDFARQFVEHKLKSEKRPMLVKNVDDTNQPSSSSSKLSNTDSSMPRTEQQKEYVIKMVGSKRTEPIINLMKENGIDFNANNNITVNGSAVPRSNIVDILKCLTNASVSRDQIHGLDEVIKVLKSSTAQKTLFPSGVRRIIFPSSRSPSRSRSQKGQGYLKNWQIFS